MRDELHFVEGPLDGQVMAATMESPSNGAPPKRDHPSVMRFRSLWPCRVGEGVESYLAHYWHSYELAMEEYCDVCQRGINVYMYGGWQHFESEEVPVA